LHQPDAHYLIPGYKTHRIAVNLDGDLIFAAGSFVPGGDFWDKAGALLFIAQKRIFQLQSECPERKSHD
jgi:hypothetical protein